MDNTKSNSLNEEKPPFYRNERIKFLKNGKVQTGWYTREKKSVYVVKLIEPFGVFFEVKKGELYHDYETIMITK